MRLPRPLLLLVFLLPLVALAQTSAPVVFDPNQPLSGQLMVWLVNGLLAALMGLVSLGLAALRRRAKDNAFALLGTKLASVAAAVANHAEAHLRPLIDKDLEDGKLTPEEAAGLKTAAMNELRLAGGPMIEELRKQFGFNDQGLATFLSGILEQAVQKIPEHPAAAPKPPQAPPPAAPPSEKPALSAVPEVKP